MDKVSSVVRQVVPEGKKPEDLREPRGLQGVARRPMPLASLQAGFRSGLSTGFKGLGQSVLKKLERSGVLAEIQMDAAKYIRGGGGRGIKGAVGRGGQPFGEDKRRILSSIMHRDGGMAQIGNLLATDIDSWQIEASGFLEDEYGKLYNAGGRGAQRKLGVRPNFNLRSLGVIDALQERANFLSGGVAEETFDRIRTVVAEEFYLKGKGPADVAGSLRDEFRWMSRVRSETIARTETGAVTSQAQWTTYSSSGVEWKRWLTTLDGRERETHFLAHGQIQLIEDPFEVGDSELMFPQDSTGPAEEVINCRCDHIPVILADEQFSGSTVWDGNLDPDAFARERQQQAA